MEIENTLTNLGLQFKAGGNTIQLSCPFAKTRHTSGKDAHPSFVIFSSFSFAKCYSCGYHADIETFFYDYADYADIQVDLEFLENYIKPVVVEDEDNKIIHENILDIFEKNDNRIDKYLETRSINRRYIPFDLYYDPRNSAVVMPIRDDEGNLLGATSRKTYDSTPSHHHYFGVKTTKCLLGHEFEDADNAIIVEGFTDLLNAYAKFGEMKSKEYNIYSTLTCSLSDWQAMRLIDMDKPIYLAWDVDEAGFKGREKALPKLQDAIFVADCRWENTKLDIGNMPLGAFERMF